MRGWGLAMAALLLAAGGGAVAGAKPRAPQAQTFTNPERYECNAESRGPLGWTTASRTFDGSGKLVGASAAWFAPGDMMSGPSIMAFWRVDADDPHRFVSGNFQGKVAVGTRDVPLVPRSGRFRMEITTHLDNPLEGYPSQGFVGRYARWRDFAYSSMGIFADWQDVYAMSRGADQIYIVARDKKGRTLAHHAVSSDLLRQAREEAGRLAVEAHAKSLHYAEQCFHEEANNDIII